MTLSICSVTRGIILLIVQLALAHAVSHKTIHNEQLHRQLLQHQFRPAPSDDFIATIPEEYRPFLHPKPKYPQYGRLSNQGAEPDKAWFHWVITTCPNRRNWGRFLSTTMLTAAFNGLHPKTINVVMCNPYQPERKLPSLLYNLQYAHNINVFYPSARFPIDNTTNAENQVKQRYWRTTVTSLLVPAMLNASNIPLLMTEDDIVFVPRVHARLSAAVYHISYDIPEGAPWYLNAYQPGPFQKINSSTDLSQPGAVATEAGKDTPFVVKREIHWGFQAVMMSPAMYELIIKHFVDIMSHPPLQNDAMYFKGHADYLVMTYLKDHLQCNEVGKTCHAFRLNPSITQHVGTTSATWQAGEQNRLFHGASDFPVRVEYPGYEPDTMW